MRTLNLIFAVLMTLAGLPMFVRADSADTWMDPTTGITWKFMVSSSGVSIGYGSSRFEAAIPPTTKGKIIIPPSIKGKKVVRIGDYAFHDCVLISSVVIPQSVVSIGRGAFEDCTGLIAVDIPEGVEDIDAEVFFGCRELASVIIPSSVMRIGRAAFGNCYSLSEVEISEGVMSIGDHTFSGCSGLRSIEIPSSVTSIGNYAFIGCSGLMEFIVDDGNKDYSALNGLLCDRSGKSIIFSPCGLSLVVIPEGVSSIGDSAFYGCGKMTSVAIPSSVSDIGDNAFYGCGGLQSVIIPEGVSSIGDSAFYGCGKMVSVAIPSSVMSIGKDAFAGCERIASVSVSDLEAWCRIQFGSRSANPLNNAQKFVVGGVEVTELTIPASVTDINDFSFQGCTCLTSVTMEEGVLNIGSSAFLGCSGLVFVTIPPSVTNVDISAFWGCNGLKSVTMPSCIHKLSETFPDAYRSIEQVIIPEGVTNIADWAFYRCGWLTTVAIPSTIKSIGSDAFRECYGLKSIVVPDGVEAIGDYAFYMCGFLSSVEIPKSVKSIGSCAFSACFNLREISVPFVGRQRSPINERESFFGYIFGESFYDCAYKAKQYGEISANAVTYYLPTSLVSVAITDAQTIAAGAFRGCESIVSLSLPPCLVDVGKCAFYECYGLKEVHIDNLSAWCGINFEDKFSNPIYFAHEIFLQDEKLSELAIPHGVMAINRFAFCGARLLTSVSVPSSVYSIGEDAFDECAGLTAVSVEDIGAWVGITFARASANPLTYAKRLLVNHIEVSGFDMPEGVESINPYSFYGCESVEEFRIANTVTNIGFAAFCGCTNLKEVHMSPSLRKVAADAFESCDAIERVDVMDVASWCNVDFVNENSNPLCRGGDLCVSGMQISELAIPNGTQKIGQYAFSKCGNITSVIIPGSVKCIGAYAFQACPNLRFLTLSNGVEKLADEAFAECRCLDSVSVPGSVREIGYGAFRWCNGLSAVDVQEGVRVVGSEAFNGCTALTHLVIPESVERIGGRAFYVCDKLGMGVVIVDGCVIGVNGGSCPSRIDLPEGTRLIADGAFESWTSIEKIVVPDTVKYIGSGAFSHCFSLRELAIPEGVREIAADLFYKCFGLISVKIPYSVTNICAMAFYNCSNLRTITIPAEVKIMGKWAFGECDKLEKVEYEGSPPVCEDSVYEFSPLSLVSYVRKGVGWEEIVSQGEWMGRGVEWNTRPIDPIIEGDEGATVTGNAETGFVIKPSEEKTAVEVTIPGGIDAGRVTVEVSPKVASVKPNGAKVRIVNGGADITEFLNVPTADGNGVVDLTKATVKEEFVKEVLDVEKGAVIDLLGGSQGTAGPTITTAPTRVGLFYQLREGETLEGMKGGDSKVGDGEPWTPEIKVKGGSAAFYSIGVGKGE